MQTYHIHINGIVQGVGFRPMVYLLAKEMHLDGYVKNDSDGVNIVFNPTEQGANIFLKKVLQQAPTQAKIISYELHKIEAISLPEFSIVIDDNDTSKKQVLLSPDTAMCSNCRNELHDKTNRRYRYAFITCTHCGPRYSIINNLPYERHNTSMEVFVMCQSCNDEYNNVAARRFFSQTNSCANCGVQLSIRENATIALSNDSEEVLSHIKKFLEQGKIIAVKGIGGYLLLCDANNDKVIQLLRSRKHRPSKPLAVLYPGIEEIQTDFELNKKERELLESAEAPIVLLYPKKEVSNTIAIKNIAPGLKRVGVMLPYNPLLELIATDFGKPLIATSANISGSPIIYKDEDAITCLFEIADYIVSHNREIIIPQDDSVVQVSKHSGQQIILRRSRGYAPSFLNYKPQSKECVLSTGAYLKSSFTLSVNGNTFVSQFLGSGESYESQQMYKNTLEHWLSLYKSKPCVIIADLHPDYFSHQYAVELAEKNDSQLKLIQHHEAHFAAVLAENNLLHSAQNILGVVWDGTGLGTDGNIRGGEFFQYQNNEILRRYHFDYFPVIAGDKMALEPRISALCALSNTLLQSEVKEKFTETEWTNYQSLIHSTNLFTSSVGRLFDAVASLLNICDKQTYEGEAAMYLQVLAEEYVTTNGFVMDESYFKADPYLVPTSSLLQELLLDIQIGKAKNYIAAKFHYSLVYIIDKIAKNMGVEKICFSGGVFQNALLVDWIQNEYRSKYQLYFHKNLSPNDENISFGQLIHYENIEAKTPKGFSGKKENLLEHVTH